MTSTPHPTFSIEVSEPPSPAVPGQIGAGHPIATDSKGNIYIAQTTAGLQKLVFKGMSAPPTR